MMSAALLYFELFWLFARKSPRLCTKYSIITAFAKTCDFNLAAPGFSRPLYAGFRELQISARDRSQVAWSRSYCTLGRAVVHCASWLSNTRGLGHLARIPDIIARKLDRSGCWWRGSGFETRSRSRGERGGGYAIHTSVLNIAFSSASQPPTTLAILLAVR